MILFVQWKASLTLVCAAFAAWGGVGGDRTPKDVGRWPNRAVVSKVGECAVDRGTCYYSTVRARTLSGPRSLCARSCLNETESVLEY
jgi:hypothetical protein